MCNCCTRICKRYLLLCAVHSDVFFHSLINFPPTCRFISSYCLHLECHHSHRWHKEKSCSLPRRQGWFVSECLVKAYGGVSRCTYASELSVHPVETNWHGALSDQIVMLRVIRRYWQQGWLFPFDGNFCF